MIDLKYQTLATFSLPSSLYAFYRIKKLRLGILINIISIMLASTSFTNMIALLSQKHIGFYFLVSGFILIWSFVIPIIFIRKWTVSYNNKVFEPLKSKDSQ